MSGDPNRIPQPDDPGPEEDYDPAHFGLDGAQCTRMAPTTPQEIAIALLNGRKPQAPFEKRLHDEIMRAIKDATEHTAGGSANFPIHPACGWRHPLDVGCPPL